MASGGAGERGSGEEEEERYERYREGFGEKRSCLLNMTV